MACYRQVNELSPVDAAYLAGLIDGEGTISLSRKHRNENRQLVVSISNTERPLLEYAARVIGAGRITRKRTYSKRHTPSFTYAVTNRQALDVLKQTAPYLKTYKEGRARLVLNDYIRLTPRNGHYPPDLSLEREEFIQRFFAISPA